MPKFTHFHIAVLSAVVLFGRGFGPAAGVLLRHHGRQGQYQRENQALQFILPARIERAICSASASLSAPSGGLGFGSLGRQRRPGSFEQRVGPFARSGQRGSLFIPPLLADVFLFLVDLVAGGPELLFVLGGLRFGALQAVRGGFARPGRGLAALFETRARYAQKKNRPRYK